MRDNLNKSFKIGFIFMGTVLGAGFASGQEILRFFCDYGFFGFIGMILTCGLLFLGGYGVLKIIKNNKIGSSRELLCLLLGENWGIAFNTLLAVFLFFMLSAMLAGGGEALHNCFRLNKGIGEIIISALVLITLLGGKNKAEKNIGEINTALCPILLIATLIISLVAIDFKVLLKQPFPMGEKSSSFALAMFFAFVYASYNMITAIPVLCALKENKGRGTALLGGLIGAVGLFIMAVFLYFCIGLKYEGVCHLPLPLLAIVRQKGAVFYMLYFILFLGAIFTTAIGNYFGIIGWLEDFGFKGGLTKIIVIFLSLAISKFGFDTLVSRVYPFFGVLGGYELIMIIKKAFFNNKRFY